MSQRISQFALIVRDYDEALAFYVDLIQRKVGERQ
jgi:hypothetical protein